MADRRSALVLVGCAEPARRLLRHAGEAAQDEGARHARRLAREVLGDLDVDYEIESRVGRKANLVLDVAAEHGCSELFLVGHRDGPWEQTTFDRVMEEVIDRFDGPVTVVMGEELEPDE